MALHDSVQVFVSRMDGITAFLGEEAPNPKQFGVILKWVEELRAAQREEPRAAAPASPAAPVSSEPVGGTHTTEWWKGRVKEALMDNDVLNLDAEDAEHEIAMVAIDLNADPKEVALRIVRAL